MNIDLLSIGFGLLGGAALMSLVMMLLDMHRRLKQLEKSSPKRLPYPTADAIENAMAAIMALQYDVEIKGDMIENAMEHLRRARNPGKNRGK